jgi:hypothetical protein
VRLQIANPPELLIDGNPIEDLLLLTNRDNIPLIMKHGKIYENAL